MHRVQWTEEALNDLNNIDPEIARRIVRKITWVAYHSEDIIPEPLSYRLSGYYKIRVGEWRVIYTMESQDVVIQAIGHRREIYKKI